MVWLLLVPDTSTPSVNLSIFASKKPVVSGRLFTLTTVAAGKKIVYKFSMLIFMPAISLRRRQKIFCATFY